MRTAIYTTREGQKWELRNVEPITFAAGFYYGDRVDNGQLVQVHEHRLVFVEEGGRDQGSTEVAAPLADRPTGM